MLNAAFAAARRAPSWLRPLLILLVLWLPTLVIGVSMALLVDLHPSALGIKAILHLSAAAALAALAYGIAAQAARPGPRARPWFLAFVASSGFFLGMAAFSSAESDTFARWQFLAIAIAGGTLALGEVLRRFPAGRPTRARRP